MNDDDLFPIEDLKARYGLELLSTDDFTYFKIECSHETIFSRLMTDEEYEQLDAAEQEQCRRYDLWLRIESEKDLTKEHSFGQVFGHPSFRQFLSRALEEELIEKGLLSVD